MSNNNNLLSSAFEECIRIVPADNMPDGSGGYIQTWKEGDKFQAGFDFQSSIEAKIAEAQGVTGLWNILVKPYVSLEFHNVFKRLSDGQIFRVTSKDDNKTPKGAGLNVKVVSAEEWELTK